MAGTCNDCGADTRGRYRICPDCRRERRGGTRTYQGSRRKGRGGSHFFCKECKYSWKSRKGDERPAVCPRCNSKSIIFDLRRNLGFAIGIAVIGIFAFILGIVTNDPLTKNVIGKIGGTIGIPLAMGLLIMMLIEHEKNKKILSKFPSKQQNEKIGENWTFLFFVGIISMFFMAVLWGLFSLFTDNLLALLWAFGVLFILALILRETDWAKKFQ